jgi:hypothetical protein
MFGIREMIKKMFKNDLIKLLENIDGNPLVLCLNSEGYFTQPNPLIAEKKDYEDRDGIFDKLDTEEVPTGSFIEIY